MWEELDFEMNLNTSLKSEFSANVAEGLYARYQLARNALVADILPTIRVVEPNLSDHGPDHIANVLQNAHRLLPPGYYKRNGGESRQRLSARDHYCLGMMILFHDVGNVFGRSGHHKKIQEVYDEIFAKNRRDSEEKDIVVRGAGAHCGRTGSGSSDTLNELAEQAFFKHGEVRLREIAAILRFADELAEGPQRTSEFLRSRGKYTKESEVYHDYASITRVNIDPKNSRIHLAYDIDVSDFIDPINPDGQRLAQLVEFTFSRIVKLDIERRYNRFYSSMLKPYAETCAVFRVSRNGVPVDLGLKPIEINDKVVPGDDITTIERVDPSYDVKRIIDAILNLPK